MSARKQTFAVRASGRGVRTQGGDCSACTMEALEGRTLMAAHLTLRAPRVPAAVPAASLGEVTRPAMTVVPRTASLTSAGDGTTVAQAQPGFQITVVFPDATLTPAQQAVFTTAANRWQQIITGDIPDFSMINGTPVDDVRIEATGPFIDGVNGILGQAGPTEIRPGTFLPIAGIMQFDSADLAALQANGSLANVIIHEMGHVLGYGTIWPFLNLTTGTGGGPDPRFTGAAALAEYQTIFGATDETGVPLENTQAVNGGTRDVHWRESSFDTELLTGFLNGATPQISRVSAAQFIDLGYPGVVVSAADNFLAPLRVTALNASASIVVPGSNVTLTATVVDSSGQLTGASFFRESNNVAGLQSTGANPDTLLGTDTIAADGLSIVASTTGLASGPYRFYARATDNDGDRSAAGNVALFAQAAVAIAGDINLNAVVGPEDFNILATNFGANGKTWTTGDLTGDGTVGPEDFNILASHFGQSLPGGGGLMASVVSSGTGTSSFMTSTPATTLAVTAKTTSAVRTSVLAAAAKTIAAKSRYHNHR